MTPTRSRLAAAPYAAVAFSACSWGTWALIIRRAASIGPLPPAAQATIVMAVITAATGVTSLRDRRPGKATARERCWVAYLGVADAFNVLLLFAAYEITVGVAVLAHYLTPILVAIASPLLLRERLTRRTVVAVLGEVQKTPIIFSWPKFFFVELKQTV